MGKKTIKSQKTLDGYTVKDAIQIHLMEHPMTNQQLQKVFNVKPRTMCNYLSALKNQGLIDVHPEDVDKWPNIRRYYAFKDKQRFSSIIEEKVKLRRENRIAKLAQKKQEIVESEKNPYATFYNLTDTVRTTSAQKSRISAWLGYGSLSNV